MALVTPVLLLIIIGALTLGHALYVRFRLTDHAAAAARACALAGTDNQTCANATWKRVKEAEGSCAWLRVRVNRVSLGDLGSVQALSVQMECRYAGGIARAFWAREGTTLNNLTVAALAPF